MISSSFRSHILVENEDGADDFRRQSKHAPMVVSHQGTPQNFDDYTAVVHFSYIIIVDNKKTSRNG